MRGKGSKVVVAFAAVLIVVLAVGCGGDSGATGTTSAEPADGSVPGSGAKPNAWNEVNEQLRGDILSFGETGSQAELDEAAVVVRGYLVARADGDSPRTCSYLSKYMLEVTEGTAEQRGERGCAAGVESLAALTSAEEVEGAGDIDPTSIRRRGKRAFVIYDDRYGDTYAMLMRPEGGTWKIHGFDATRLY